MGSDSNATSAPTLLAARMLPRCPSRPKPVTSVAALTPTASAARAAPSLSVVMDRTASAMPASIRASRLRAVARMPVPSGLVSTSTSPAHPPALVRARSGWTSPITTRPKIGSSTSIECPPSIRQRARSVTSAAPPSTSASISNGSFSRGQPTRLRANSGVAPMAYTSLSALAAAIAPQARGSSTIGVKKSVVATRARSSLSLNTAASSRLAASTSTRGSTTGGKCRSTSFRSTEPSLQAQPAPCDRAVRRMRGAAGGTCVMPEGIPELWRTTRSAGAVGPEHRAEHDQRPFLLRHGPEAAIASLPLEHRGQRAGDGNPRRLDAGRLQRFDGGERVGVGPPTCRTLVANHQGHDPRDDRLLRRAAEREGVEPGDDRVRREEAGPHGPLVGQQAEAFEVESDARILAQACSEGGA